MAKIIKLILSFRHELMVLQYYFNGEFMNTQVKGIIISETDFAEYDKYITLLTYESGKISVFCKGVRRKNSPLINRARTFVFGQFELFFNKDRYILKDVEVIERFFEITEDIERFAVCSYFLQLASKLSDTDFPNKDTTRTLISALYAISKQKRNISLVKSVVEIRLMSIAGFPPVIDKCGICNAPSNTIIPFFDTMQGQVCCSDCVGKNPYLHEISMGILRAMYHILTCDVQKLYSFELNENNIEILSKVSEEYVLKQTEYKFKSLDFYKTIIQGG
ncbi:MAG: DNA repair protein RecO [Clostridia bacterium]